ncbi:MAG TPA: hypothetical protein VNT99_09255, partial [Methylomirabilota bacterium]|nr:hypothetical protein [Methylomirabilota bacterium]
RYDRPTHEHDDPSAIAVDADNNIVMTDSGGYTAKYAAADGALLWEKLHGPGANTRSLGIDQSGDVFVAGSAYNGRFGGNYDFAPSSMPPPMAPCFGTSAMTAAQN